MDGWVGDGWMGGHSWLGPRLEFQDTEADKRTSALCSCSRAGGRRVMAADS